MSRIFALLVLSVGVSFGGVCKSPKCTAGDATTCESTVGCSWDGESAYCGGPVCDSASSESACGKITNCTWQPSPSTCTRPSSKLCGSFSESDCSNKGCRWVADSSECSGPSSGQCKAKSQTECQKEDSGCRWQSSNSSSGYCGSPECYGRSLTACGGVKGCKWQPGTCYYSTSYCGSLAENACKNDGNCKYTPRKAGCWSPSSSQNKCTNLNPTKCKETSGCQFSEDYYSCSSDSPNVLCSRIYNNPNNMSEFTCSEGCTKKLVWAGNCSLTGGGPISCSNNADNTNCSSDSISKGCFWDLNYQKGVCQYDYGCEGLSESACNSNGYCWFSINTPGSCNDDPKIYDCASFDPDNCTNADYCERYNVNDQCESSDPAVDGCNRNVAVNVNGDEVIICSDYSGLGLVNCSVIKNGNCREKQYYCSNYHDDPASCSGSGGCIYQAATGVCISGGGVTPPADGGYDGYDEVASGLQRSLGALPVCSSNADNTGCADGSPSGCSFSAGSCTVDYANLYCQTGVNDCTQTSKDLGCVWSPGSGNETDGYCESDSQRWKCYKNGMGTGCDENFSSGYCTFKTSPGYCTGNSQLACIVNADGNGCDGSSDAGCKWISDRGYCSNTQNCYENSAGDDCDKPSKDAGCTFYKATPASCKPYTSNYCFSNATGDGCTDLSITAGCVWDNGSAASLIHVPIFLLLVVLLLNL